MDFVLVHGAFHGAWCWDRLIPELESRGHSAVAMDLPIDVPDAGAAEYARAVESVMGGLDEPVLVGHSMAGLVLPLVAASRPVRLMVFLAALLPSPGTTFRDQRKREPILPEIDPAAGAFTHIGEGLYVAGSDTAIEMYYQDVPDELATWAADRLRPQSYLYQREITPLTEWPDTACAYIVCRDDRAVNPAWGRKAARDRLGVDPHEIDGGHSPFLSRPSELADLLDLISG